MYLNRLRQERLEEQNEIPYHIRSNASNDQYIIYTWLRTVLCRPNYTQNCNHVLKHVIYYKFSILEFVTSLKNKSYIQHTLQKELHLIIKHQTY